MAMAQRQGSPEEREKHDPTTCTVVGRSVRKLARQKERIGKDEVLNLRYTYLVLFVLYLVKMSKNDLCGVALPFLSVRARDCDFDMI